MNSNEVRRLGRPSISCALCRKRKLKCDRASPCSNCLRSRSRTPTIDCIYEDHGSPSSTSPEHPPKRRAQPPPPTQQQQPTPVDLTPHTPHTSSSTPASRSVPPSDQDQPPRRSVTPTFIQFHTLASPPGSPEAPKALQTSESVKAHCLIEHNFFGETYKLEWGIAHKSRVFGQSHWLGIVEYFQDLVELTTPYLQNKTAKAILSLRKCKDLGREIKSQRTPPWPTPPTDTLPPKPLSDSLVHAYLQTTETLYRVFHVPSFKRDYDALWLTTPSTPTNKAFLVQLKLVLAIGATSYDPTFSLRSSAVTWVYEAQTYLSEPHCKSRLGLQYLQTNILLMIAREATGIDSDSVWISAGSLIRLAMNMGLHKDPASLLVGRPASRISCEMRRRLWNTILELTLQSSFDSGKPALISLEDFDTQCPGNFDDEQLVEESLARGEGEVTGMSVAIALRRTLGVRLEIARVLNNQGVRGGYEKTLRFDGELRGLYRGIVRDLREGRGGDTERFDVCALDVIVHRYLASLHVPFLGCSGERGMGIASAYSRKAAVESALRIHAAGAGWPDKGNVGSIFGRYTQCSSGFFPYAVFQADLIVAVELKSQLREEASLGPAMLRPDLVDLLEDSKGFSLRCIEAGETNVKAYLFRCMAVAQIEGLRRGLENSELMEVVVGEAEEAVGVCVPMLEGVVGGRWRSVEGDDGSRNEVEDGLREMTEDGTEDWDFLISGGLFNAGGGMDLMDWMVADDDGHGMVL